MPRLLSAAIAVLLCAAPVRAQCTMSWSDAFCGNGLESGTVQAALVLDDGTGPSLYVGESFIVPGGAASAVARWHAGGWTGVPGLLPAANSTNGAAVAALALYDAGSGPRIYAGGTFATAGGAAAGNVASLDGTSWSTLGAGVAGSPIAGTDPRIHAMIAFDDGTGPQLVVAGRFTTAGGAPANSIARWNGTAWSPMSFGFTQVYALAVHDAGTGPALYAAATITLGTTTVHSVAQWTGSTWATVGGPADGPVLALTSFSEGPFPRLMVGGTFTSINGVAANNVARWDGVQWSGLGSGTNGTVRTLRGFDDGTGPALYVGGSFTMNGASQLARFSGGVWSTVGGGVSPFGSGVWALAQLPTATGPVLAVCGSFLGVLPAPGSSEIAANRVVGWTGSSWYTFGGGMGGTRVSSFATFDDGMGPALYAAGNFTTAGTAVISHVARRTPTGWAPVGAAFDGPVVKIEVCDYGTGPALYAGGTFTACGGVPMNSVAQLVNGAWTPLSYGMTGQPTNSVHDFEVFDDGTGPALYAAGQFEYAGGYHAKNIAKWNGTSWTALGSLAAGPDGPVNALQIFDDGSGPGLYVGGLFSWSYLGFVNAVSTPRIARWRGSTWSAVGGLDLGYPSSWVGSLTVHDFGSGPRLVAGGKLGLGGSSPVIPHAAAQWTGSSWSSVGGLFPAVLGGADGWTFAHYDDGAGPALYLGTAWNGGGAPYSTSSFPRLWRFTSGGWIPFGIPTTSASPNLEVVQALHVTDDGAGTALWVGGTFASAAVGIPSGNIARFGHPRARISLSQPGGPGSGAYVVSSDLLPGHEYFNVFSPDVCPGPPGSGPYLGLCANDVNSLIWQVLLPVGSPPFHYIANDRNQTFGPFAVPTGSVFDAICSDFTGGMVNCVSNVGRLTVQ